MKKRPARRDQSRAKLRDKMLTLLQGANGGYELLYFQQKPGERVSLPADIGLDVFGRWLGALQRNLTFVSEDQRAFIARPSMLEKYDSFDEAAAWLFEIGVPA